MPRTFLLFAALAWGIPLCAQASLNSPNPAYTQTTIVNSATSTDDALAPNTIATIYGSNLSAGSTVSAGNLVPGEGLPQSIAGVQVFVAGQPVGLYYVSPGQINFLIPADLRPGTMDLFVAIDGLAGPQVQINLADTGLGLFESAPGVITATHANGGLVTKSHPAQPGETVTIYGTGFGATTPNVISDMISMTMAQITDLSSFSVLVNGKGLAGSSVLYAGVSPGTPGLYQATVKLPKALPANPQIRVAIGDQSSQSGLVLPVQ